MSRHHILNTATIVAQQGLVDAQIEYEQAVAEGKRLARENKEATAREWIRLRARQKEIQTVQNDFEVIESTQQDVDELRKLPDQRRREHERLVDEKYRAQVQENAEKKLWWKWAHDKERTQHRDQLLARRKMWDEINRKTEAEMEAKAKERADIQKILDRQAAAAAETQYIRDTLLRARDEFEAAVRQLTAEESVARFEVNKAQEEGRREVDKARQDGRQLDSNKRFTEYRSLVAQLDSIKRELDAIPQQL
eukprot:NODE_3560_length_877_cov_69.913333_g3538_i0.p2 GENE.NODE_3560_length_877_cov_69.913333_g3538_i0~~NODE_3560_length_877_cov_69.913333_g3538_i0.p2  ORF type:complete len:251 (-),score=47.16 NODE_3560_length_877_cov_69.913333_g3538_i0:22-774(-)